MQKILRNRRRSIAASWLFLPFSLAICCLAYADSHAVVAAAQPSSCEESFQKNNLEAQRLMQSCKGGNSTVTKARLGGSALFDYNSDELSAAGLRALRKLINDLREYREIKSIDIVGHTDSHGPKMYNQVLSENRAWQVVEVFSTAFAGLPVTWSGKGESEPIATNKTAAGRNKNRRVDITVNVTAVR